jgi:hypothetical protein
MHLVRAISVAVVALGLSAQAAQARPFGIESGGAAVQTNAPSQRASVNGLNLLAGTAATQPSASRHASAVSLGELAAQVKSRWQSATQAIPPSQQASTPGSGSSGVNWTSVLGGAAIIALVGGLGAVMYRHRPHRPATV